MNISRKFFIRLLIFTWYKNCEEFYRRQNVGNIYLVQVSTREKSENGRARILDETLYWHLYVQLILRWFFITVQPTYAWISHVWKTIICQNCSIIMITVFTKSLIRIDVIVITGGHYAFIMYENYILPMDHLPLSYLSVIAWRSSASCIIHIKCTPCGVMFWSYLSGNTELLIYVLYTAVTFCIVALHFSLLSVYYVDSQLLHACYMHFSNVIKYYYMSHNDWLKRGIHWGMQFQRTTVARVAECIEKASFL